MSMQGIKAALVGLRIEDAGLINKGGVRHVRLLLGDAKEPLLVPLDEVSDMVAMRKPQARATQPKVFSSASNSRVA